MICFCLAGVKVALHFGFFAVLFLIVELTESDWALWGVFCCLVHELGHAVAYALCGARPRELHFEAGGMRFVPPEGLLSAGREAFILAAGPLANLLAGGILCLGGGFRTAGAHFLLAGFNLLPLALLDGGQLFALLLEELLPPRPAERMARAVHLLCLAGMGVCGLLLLRETGNFTLLLTLFCLAADSGAKKRGTGR